MKQEDEWIELFGGPKQEKPFFPDTPPSEEPREEPVPALPPHVSGEMGSGSVKGVWKATRATFDSFLPTAAGGPGRKESDETKRKMERKEKDEKLREQIKGKPDGRFSFQSIVLALIMFLHTQIVSRSP